MVPVYFAVVLLIGLLELVPAPPPPPPLHIPISSCKDVYDRAGANGAVSGEYYLTNDEGELYKVYCEFYDDHIYTFVAPTSLPSIPLDNLYNNKKELLIRHRLDDGTQREVKYGQIQKYRERDIVVQYNQNDGYNNINNAKMGPYIYVGLLPIAGIKHKGDIQGYSVDGSDFTFRNCDGNPNNYFVLLFNENNAQFTGYNVDQPLMRKWMTLSSRVPTERELPEDFFSQFEMHMGGCGGYLTSNQVSGFDGVTIGLRYDIPISSCKDVYDRASTNGAVSGEYYLTNDEGELYKVYCEFYDDHIYTFVAPTSLPSIPLDNLHNNKTELLIRHRLDDGTQREVKYGQIQKYRERDIVVQYNQNDGYNNINNAKMGPYIYVGLLPIAGIKHKGDIQGYSVDGRDFTFRNCDGNPNNYFVLLFNENNAQFTGYNVDQPLMRKWMTLSSRVPTERELPEDFFSQFEMHMGGCGGYLTSNQVSGFDGVTIGLRYDIPISSCKDVYDRAGANGAVSGEYYLTNDEGELYKVYCEFYDDHIYTFVAPTSLPSIPLDNLYNNKKELLIRHRLDDGTQREVKYGQIQKYRERDIVVQYNQNDGYNNINNAKMGPYIYVGLLPIAGIKHKGDIQGYSVDGSDFTFRNCDGNPNNYFVLLFNENNAQFTGYNVDQPLMRKWMTLSSRVPTERELPEDFFSQFEMHMGGCGGYLTSNQVSGFDGVTIGLRYDIPISSCKDVYDRASANGAVSGEYYLTNDEGELYKVYCEFYDDHIYTFVAPTSLPSIPLDNLYNNKTELLIRHRLDDGTQREVKYGQIQKYRERDIVVQYNQNDGYNNINNAKMGPYIYVGLLPIAGIKHKGDIQGYSVDGRDFTFRNCDGNPNNYFVLLFNENNAQFTGYNVDQPLMRKWMTLSSRVPTERELPEDFFSQFEMHMGGCGGYLTSNQVSGFDGVTIGLRYDIPISSCKDVYDRAGANGAVSGEYYLTNDEGELYKVYCEFYDDHIYTFVAPTSLPSIPLDNLYNNKKELLIRHRLDDGTQREVKYGQIQKYRERDIVVQYNQNDGYNNINNAKMGPYIYVGLLPIAGIKHKGDIQGYSVDGSDFTFRNCDGNPNNYFVLLFNENNAQFTGYNVDQPLMRKWMTLSSRVPTESELPEDFFSQFEMHMGGCGGYLTSNQVSGFDGVTIGLRYDIPSA